MNALTQQQVRGKDNKEQVEGGEGRGETDGGRGKEEGKHWERGKVKHKGYTKMNLSFRYS